MNVTDRDSLAGGRLGKLVKIDLAKMTIIVKLKILENDEVPTVWAIIEEGFVYLHDNDPKQPTKLVKNCFYHYWSGRHKALITTQQN